mmetsp:Transcript_23163/g.44125  ORF Transcript_23163/g.44125 Transcript_23163/m.44125 type:complete len:233 (+) Transcript_23163:94-792(+)
MLSFPHSNKELLASSTALANTVARAALATIGTRVARKQTLWCRRGWRCDRWRCGRWRCGRWRGNVQTIAGTGHRGLVSFADRVAAARSFDNRLHFTETALCASTTTAVGARYETRSNRRATSTAKSTRWLSTRDTRAVPRTVVAILAIFTNPVSTISFSLDECSCTVRSADIARFTTCHVTKAIAVALAHASRRIAYLQCTTLGGTSDGSTTLTVAGTAEFHSITKVAVGAL